MTLNGHCALHCTKHAFFGAHNENLNDGKHVAQTLVSYGISFMWIVAGFCGERASNDSGVIEDVDFQCFLTLNLPNLRN